MTEKLYYADCHLERFTAHVTGCRETEKGWEVTLDRTAFYPEGGGQACDLGILGGVKVLDVRERGEEIFHLCESPLEMGAAVEGVIDYEHRFDLMQQHTGEHIVSGVVHSRYGYHNTGFHIGEHLIQIDFDGVIPPQDLPQIEAVVNRAIWSDIPVKCWYPEAEELPNVFYRTKKALPWPVRIVQVPGYDSCACCGVHVERTGEIGLVKLTSVMGFRGGSRMELACGGRALKLLCDIFDQNRQVSQAFSAKISETGAAARKMNEALEAAKFQITGLQRRLFAGIAEGYVNCESILHFEEGLDPVLVRELADLLADRAAHWAAVFSGTESEGYSFCLVSRGEDLRAMTKAMTQALSGRGGGKPGFQQGKVGATKEQIEAFFQTV